MRCERSHVCDLSRAVFIPFAVGGGISSLDDMSRVLLAGAEKISVNSLAVRSPQIIEEHIDELTNAWREHLSF